MRAWFPWLSLFLAANVFAVPPIEHWTQENGTKVYFIEARELPMIDIRVLFDAGGARDGERPGLASMTNGMLAQGAGEWNADQIAERFDGVGANFSSGVDADRAFVSLRSLSDPTLLDPALDALIALISHPTFPAAAFERERKRQLRSLSYQKQVPSKIASKAFYRALYGDHPYAHPEEGTEESLEAMTVADLRAFYQQYYVAANATIAIVGALDQPAAKELAASITAQLPQGKAPPPLPKPNPIPGKHQHLDHPASQTHVWLGQLGYSRYDPDYFTLYVGNHILGGGGLVARISEEVREKRGLSYSAYSYFSPLRVKGPFIAGLQTKNAQTEEAIQVLKQTIRDFAASGPTEQELTAAQKNLTGGFPLKIDSNAKLLAYLSMIGFYGLPVDYLDTWIDKVNAVTREDIQRAFQRLEVDKMVLITVGRGAKP